MKRFSTILVLIFITSEIYSQNYWEYPVVPGTKEWKELKTLSEIIAVQQVPESVLNNMTTEEVFQAWLDLPGRMEMLAFNTMQSGFEVTKKRYNVIPELLNRTDAGPVILTMYLETYIPEIKSAWSSIEKGKYITDFGFTEFLLSQPEVLSTLSYEQKKDFIRHTNSV